MSDFIASPDEVTKWLRGLAGKYPVLFPQKHGSASYRFSRVVNESLIQFDDYQPTIVPPVKTIVPAWDEMLRFVNKPDGSTQVSPSVDTSFRVMAGVRACDVKGIFLMDLFYHDGVSDPYYLARRENTAIVGYGCRQPCDERVFCAAVDSLDHREGADIFLDPVRGGMMLVEVRTEQGRRLLDGTDFEPCDDGPARMVGVIANRPDPFGRAFKARVEKLPDIINGHWKSPVWDKHVERCFSCGTCNLVCPTCYCYEVHDDLNLDAQSGTRVRTWDGCMLPHFSVIAGNHNFRPEPASRQRHRVKRKFEYLPNRYGYGSACVGCGRCGRQCTSGIDIYDIVNELTVEGP